MYSLAVAGSVPPIDTPSRETTYDVACALADHVSRAAGAPCKQVAITDVVKAPGGHTSSLTVIATGAEAVDPLLFTPMTRYVYVAPATAERS
jgi:hypothetical protein